MILLKSRVKVLPNQAQRKVADRKKSWRRFKILLKSRKKVLPNQVQWKAAKVVAHYYLQAGERERTRKFKILLKSRKKVFPNHAQWKAAKVVAHYYLQVRERGRRRKFKILLKSRRKFLPNQAQWKSEMVIAYHLEGRNRKGQKVKILLKSRVKFLPNQAQWKAAARAAVLHQLKRDRRWQKVKARIFPAHQAVIRVDVRLNREVRVKNPWLIEARIFPAHQAVVRVDVRLNRELRVKRLELIQILLKSLKKFLPNQVRWKAARVAVHHQLKRDRRWRKVKARIFPAHQAVIRVGDRLNRELRVKSLELIKMQLHSHNLRKRRECPMFHHPSSVHLHLILN
uniref:uncharacterized protein LOC120337404 n=1 Tax=Styela clava TaxID=7725 RepID=UPI0019398FC5|nr:uncharacterized protein LOC120337404 [Styela clava]